MAEKLGVQRCNRASGMRHRRTIVKPSAALISAAASFYAPLTKNKAPARSGELRPEQKLSQSPLPGRDRDDELSTAAAARPRYQIY